MGSGYGIAVELAVRSALLFFLFGSVFCVAYGLGLLMGSAWVTRLNEWGRRWVSSRQAMRKMEVSHSLEGAVYNRHNWAGLVILLASVYVLAILLVQYDMKSLVGLLRARGGSIVEDLAARAAWLLLVVGAFAGVMLGLSLLLRPRLVQRAEGWLNRNFSARRATRFLEVMNLGPDHWISSYPRVSGAAITLGSVYIAYSLGIVFFSGI